MTTTPQPKPSTAAAEPMEWWNAIDLVKPYIFQVFTPQGSGTGFQIAYAPKSELCGVATAAHVVSHAHEWEEPIRLVQHASGTVRVLKPADRFVFIDYKTDTACIVFPKGTMKLVDKPLELIPEDKHLRVGNEIGWLGFPAISTGNLCFFSGRASCWVQSENAYLVDGVAIHGVSGGPSFYLADKKTLRVIGIVSSYIPNRTTGDSLPGLCVVRDVSPFQQTIKDLKDLEQAKQEAPPLSIPPATAPQVAAPAGTEVPPAASQPVPPVAPGKA